MIEQIKLLGHVGVDSGQLMITDPCYIDSEWEEAEGIIAMDLWGTAARDIFPALKNRYPDICLVNDTIRYETDDTTDAQLFYQAAMFEAKKANKRIVGRPITPSTYDQICDLTLSKERGGPIPFSRGHEGFLVAFSSGYGDGEELLESGSISVPFEFNPEQDAIYNSVIVEFEIVKDDEDTIKALEENSVSDVWVRVTDISA